MIDLSQLEKTKTETDIAKESETANAIAYLKETDWYVIRNLETGKIVPSDIAEARKKARLIIL